MGGIVELLYELSVDCHKPATFLNDNGKLFSHVAYTVAGRVVVQFCFTVGVVVLPIEAVGHHFLLACPSSSPVMNTANTMITRPTNSVIIDLPECALLLG